MRLYDYNITPELGATLYELLEPLLPSSIPILAQLSTPPRPVVYRAWSSIPLDLALDELHFCLATLTLDAASEPQLRFYHSAEHMFDEQQDRTTEPRDAAVDAEVAEFMKAWIPQLPTEAKGKTTGVTMLGSVHDFWVPVFKEWQTYDGPCFKYVLPPQPERPLVELPSGAVLGPLKREDIPQVVSTTYIPRSSEYITTRLPHSSCIKENGVAVAWIIQHSDGTLGTLYVDPTQRGKGYARLLVQHAVAEHLYVLDKDGAFVKGKPWCHTDVVASNAAGAGLFKSLRDWRSGWACTWIGLSPNLAGSAQ